MFYIQTDITLYSQVHQNVLLLLKPYFTGQDPQIDIGQGQEVTADILGQEAGTGTEENQGHLAGAAQEVEKNTEGTCFPVLFFL